MKIIQEKEGSKKMKRIKKVYGVYGMMEYQALVPTLNEMLKIEFTGGALSGYGIRPATYATESPMVQYFIERSAQFRSGRIKLVTTIK